MPVRALPTTTFRIVTLGTVIATIGGVAIQGHKRAQGATGAPTEACMQKTDTVEAFLARGGKITKCTTGTHEAQSEATSAHNFRVREIERLGDTYAEDSERAAECGMSVYDYQRRGR